MLYGASTIWETYRRKCHFIMYILTTNSSTITCLFLDQFAYMFSLPPKVIGKSSEVLDDTGTEEKYLIATSEQTLCALHR